MTAYELMDVRASVSESYMSAMRFWMTLTLACFGAGSFISGPGSLASFVLLFVYYTSSNIGFALYLRQLGKEIDAVETDIVAYAEAHPEAPDIVSPGVVKTRYMNRTLQTGSATAMPLVMIVYFYSLYTG
jgi:Na+/pantothenate symporter